jgi:hypothetical protein
MLISTDQKSPLYARCMSSPEDNSGVVSWHAIHTNGKFDEGWDVPNSGSTISSIAIPGRRTCSAVDVTSWINTRVEAIPKGFRVGMDHTLD